MAEYTWQPLAVGTQYGDVNVNDPLAVAQLRMRAQQEIQQQRVDAAMQLAAEQQRVMAEAQAAQQAAAQARLDEANAALAAREAAAQQRAQAAQNPAAQNPAQQGGMVGMWEAVKQKNNYANLSAAERATLIEQVADATARDTGADLDSRNKLADALRKYEEGNGGLNKTSWWAEPTQTAWDTGTKLAGGLAGINTALLATAGNAAKVVDDTARDVAKFFLPNDKAAIDSTKTILGEVAKYSFDAARDSAAVIDKAKSLALSDEQLADDAIRSYRANKAMKESRWVDAAATYLSDPIDFTVDMAAYFAPALVAGYAGGPMAARATLASQGFGTSVMTHFDTAYAAAKESGKSDDEATRMAIDQASSAAAQLQHGLSAGLAVLEQGAPVGKVLTGLKGTSPMVARMAEAGTKLAASESKLVRGAAKLASNKYVAGAAAEATQETLQSAQEQYNSNLAEVKAGKRSEDKLWENVGDAAAVGALTAAAPGAGFAVFDGNASDRKFNVGDALVDTATGEGQPVVPTIDDLEREKVARDTAVSATAVGLETPMSDKDFAKYTVGNEFAPTRADAGSVETYLAKVDTLLDDTTAQIKSAEKELADTPATRGTTQATIDALTKKGEKLAALQAKLITGASKSTLERMTNNPEAVASAMFTLGTANDKITTDAQRRILSTATTQAFAQLSLADKNIVYDKLNELHAAPETVIVPPAPKREPVKQRPSTGKVDEAFLREKFGAGIDAVLNKPPVDAAAEAAAREDTDNTVSTIAEKLLNQQPLTEQEQVMSTLNSYYKDAVANRLQQYQSGEEITPAERQRLTELGELPQRVIELGQRMRDEGIPLPQIVDGVMQIHDSRAASMAARQEFTDSVAHGDVAKLAEAAMGDKPIGINMGQTAAERQVEQTAQMDQIFAEEFVQRMEAFTANLEPLSFYVGVEPNPELADYRERVKTIDGLRSIVDKYVSRMDKRDPNKPAAKLMLDTMLSVVPDNVNIQFKAGNYAAKFDEGTLNITVNPNAGELDAVIVHELMHLATARKIDVASKAQGDTARQSYDALVETLTNPDVVAVLERIGNLEMYRTTDPLNPDMATYVKEAVQLITDVRSGPIRAALDEIKVPSTALRKTSVLREIWSRVLGVLGLKGGETEISAFDSLFMHSMNMIGKPTNRKRPVSTMTEKARTLYALSYSGVDYVKAKLPNSLAAHDGVAWYDYDTQKWEAQWTTAANEPKTGTFETFEDATVAMSHDGLVILGRGKNVKLEEALPPAEVRLSIFGKTASWATRIVRTMRGNGYDAQETLEAAQDAGITFTGMLSGKLKDDMSVLDFMDKTGKSREEIKHVRRTTAVALDRRGYGKQTIYDAIESFKERLQKVGASLEQIREYAEAMNVAGYLKAVARNNGDDPYVAAVTAFRGSQFQFKDKNGKIHKAVFSPNMTWEQKVDAEMAVVNAYFAQLKPGVADVYKQIMSPLWVANNMLLDLALDAGTIDAKQHELYKDNLYYVPLKNHELHTLVGMEAPQGRYTRADNPALMLAAQLQAMRIRIGRDLEHRKLAELVMQNPSGHFEIAIEPIDIRNQEVRWKSPFAEGGTIIRVPDGQGNMIAIRAKSGAAIAYAKRNYMGDGSAARIVQTLAGINRWRALMTTTTSVRFILKSIAWDALGVLFNAQGAMGIDPKTGKYRLAIADYPRFMVNVFYYAMKNFPDLVRASAGGKVNNPLVQLYHGTGGGINVLPITDFEAMRRNISSAALLNSGKMMNALQDSKLDGSVAVANAAVGGAKTLGHGAMQAAHTMGDLWRFGTFAAAMEHQTGVRMDGITHDKLLQLAKDNPEASRVSAQASNDVTTDFSLKGASPVPRSLFMYLQAAVTSTTRTLPMILKSPVGQAWAVGLMALALAAREQECEEMGVDPDGKPRCLRAKKQDETISFGGKFGIPVFPEGRIFTVFGRNVGDVFDGRISLFDAFFGSDECPSCGIVQTIATALSPLRYNESDVNAHGTLAMFVPDGPPSWFATYLSGKDDFGRPIAKDRVDGNDNPADWQRGRNSDTDLAKEVARRLAATTDGAIDILPFTVDYVAKEALGSHYTMWRDWMNGKTGLESALAGYATGYDPYALPEQKRRAVEDIGKDLATAQAKAYYGDETSVYEADKLRDAQKRLAQIQRRARRIKTEGMTLGEIYTARNAAMREGDRGAIDYYNGLIENANAQDALEQIDMLDK